MPEIVRVTLDREDRLDKALAAVVPEGLGLSRARLQTLIAEGHVRVASGGAPLAGLRAKLPAGTELEITLPEARPSETLAQDIALNVVFEDEHLIVIDKPAGMVVHPAAGALDGTLVNALLHHCGASLSGIGGEARPGIVHRIDKETSGLLVAAKSDAAHQGLATQFAAHTIERRYLAITRGVPERSDARLGGLEVASWENGNVLRIASQIGRHPRDRKRQAVLRAGGRHAVTRMRVIEALGRRAALVECWLETGRTHQIRVHLSHVGHPLIGDPVYYRGAYLTGLPRQALHAARLGFVHPITGEEVSFVAEPPADFAAALEDLRQRA